MYGLRFLALAVFVVGLTGCGGDGLKRVKVKGKITAKGQPVDKAALVFLPMGPTKGLGGIGGSDANGNFTVMGASTTTHQRVAGIVPGEYRVRVSRMLARDGSALPEVWTEAEFPDARETIPPKYITPTSPLTVKVTESGEVTIDIPEGLVKAYVPRR